MAVQRCNDYSQLGSTDDATAVDAEETRSVYNSMTEDFKKRFGLLEILGFLASTFFIILVAILLTLMWYWGHLVEQQPTGNLLTSLALRGWLPQFITALAAVLRLATGAQALVCCMMLASLALLQNAIRGSLDRHGVAILQEAGPGPHALWLPFTRAAFRGRYICGWLAATILFITSTLLQFSSTMLLGDFATAHLLRDSTNIMVDFTSKPFLDDSKLARLDSRPLAFPVFAEKAEGRNELVSSTTDPGLFDTGSVSRAYLPLVSTDRIRVYDYQGFATVLTSQTICFAPDIANLKMTFDAAPSEENVGQQKNARFEFRLNGTIPSPTRSRSPLYSQYHERNRMFNFDSPLNQPKADLLSPCPPVGLAGLNICYLSGWSSGNDKNTYASQWYLITRVAVSRDMDINEIAHLRPDTTEPAVEFEGAEWTKQTWSNNNNRKLIVRHSLCVTKPTYTHANVSVGTPGLANIHTEPGVVRINPLTSQLNLDAVMLQMGVDAKRLNPPWKRSILALGEHYDLVNRSKYEGRESTISTPKVLSKLPGSSDARCGACLPSDELAANEVSTIKNLVPKCVDWQQFTGDPTVWQLFVKVWQRSGSLALAFEAFSNFAFLSIYTPWPIGGGLVGGEPEKPATVSFLEGQLVPRKWRGYGLVMGLVGCHTFVLFLVIGEFVASATYQPLKEKED